MSERFVLHVNDDGWHWRLLGSNNRDLAHSVEALDSAVAARREAAEVAVLASHGRIEVVGTRMSWRWMLTDGVIIRAVAGHDYRRREDCRRAGAAFRLHAARAAAPALPPESRHDDLHTC